ncbi:MAG: succinylglutamate desuccinylase/aspartoacylase family protein [Myxococcota bacterium]
MLKPRFTKQLELDDLPSESLTPFWIELIQDGLSQPVEIPVLVAKGKKPGPIFGITAALHGNELNGIPVLHNLLNNLPLNRMKGTVAGVIAANTIAVHHHKRRLNEGVDPNHIMPGKKTGSTAEVYVHRLFNRVVTQFNYLIDLHTSSFGRNNSLYVRADMKNKDTRTMAYLQHPQIIVHNPPSDYTLRGSAMEHGIPAITLEIGDPQVFQTKYVKRSIRGIKAVLREFELMPRKKVAIAPPPVICKSSYWLYTQQGGFLEVLPEVTEIVEKDQVIARIVNPFGTLIKEYKSPEKGIVVGKSVNPVAQTGSRIIHLGLIDETEVF